MYICICFPIPPTVVMYIYSRIHLPIAGHSGYQMCIFNIYLHIHLTIVDALRNHTNNNWSHMTSLNQRRYTLIINSKFLNKILPRDRTILAINSTFLNLSKLNITTLSRMYAITSQSCSWSIIITTIIIVIVIPFHGCCCCWSIVIV